MTDTEQYQRTYRIWYTVDGGEPVRITLYTTDGHTNFESIRKILAVSHFDNNDQISVDRVEVLEVTMTEKVAL